MPHRRLRVVPGSSDLPRHIYQATQLWNRILPPRFDVKSRYGVLICPQDHIASARNNLAPRIEMIPCKRLSNQPSHDSNMTRKRPRLLDWANKRGRLVHDAFSRCHTGAYYIQVQPKCESKQGLKQQVESF